MRRMRRKKEKGETGWMGRKRRKEKKGEAGWMGRIARKGEKGEGRDGKYYQKVRERRRWGWEGIAKKGREELKMNKKQKEGGWKE